MTFIGAFPLCFCLSDPFQKYILFSFLMKEIEMHDYVYAHT